MVPKPLVNIVVAHKLEADPLLAILRMRKSNLDCEFPLYINEEGFALTISGQGRHASTRAVFALEQAFTSQSSKHPTELLHSAWLNVGIAGHQNAQLGCALLVNKVEESATGESLYPAPLPVDFSPGRLEVSKLITVDIPEQVYPENSAYDMEGSGYMRAALKNSLVELVAIVKVVSDNRANPAEELNIKNVPEILGNREAELLRCMTVLRDRVLAWREVHSDREEYKLLSNRLHLTATQHIQLRRLCQRFYALQQENLLADLTRQALAGQLAARELINALELELADVGL